MNFDANSIPNRFDFAEAQPRIYQMWLENNCFQADSGSDKPAYTIVIPPPNVTGALHLGHALNNTLQDIVIRMKRMQGFNTLWVPGTDHAGIATQAVVERRLKEEEGKTRHDLGREKLVERIWQWKEQYEKRILGQLQQMGCSCDWSRTRFTLDDTCARAVRNTFFDLFQKSLIYRGKRLVNWDTFLQTAVSDDEVFSKTVKGNFWHLKYPFIDPRPGEPDHVVVATTRPETMLGDTAVAVHPDPEAALKKYESELQEKLAKASESDKSDIEAQIEAAAQRRSAMLDKLIQLTQMAKDGRKLMLPLMNREIPLVLDTWAKPELGSGCVKITPAHDPNDYEVAKRVDLPMINIMNPDGTLNAETADYQGLTLKDARKRVVEDLDAAGNLIEVEDREIELPHSDRSKTPIEPYLADQWFVKMDSLAQSAMDAVTDGNVNITPKRYEKGYLDWLSEKRDWPVSRQLWWGHQIPVWSLPCEKMPDAEAIISKIKSSTGYSTDVASIQTEECYETDEAKRRELDLPDCTIHVCIKEPSESFEVALTEMGFIREEDVLDTWFSSALWPHSTLGWPDATDDLKTFFPTSTLITSRDIITLWVARMVLASINNIGTAPFKEVYIHPKIMDGFGETMSKSKGNGIDPIDVIQKFGADSLRFGMADLATETQDVRLPVKYECPHCQESIDQTKKNRILPAIECKSCKKLFSTQWAESEEDQALPRGPVIGDRFENARNFTNKLWNASRFAMINLQGYKAGPLSIDELTLEDRWILSRLCTVSSNVTRLVDVFKFSEAAKELKDFAWDEFCSFYVEMLKDRFADDAKKVTAQRMLAFTLDVLLRLLHPFIPFITEEIWQTLAQICPERGFNEIEIATPRLVVASWPELSAQWQQPEIEKQFHQFQTALGAVREIRSGQNIKPKTRIDFSVKTSDEIAERLEQMAVYFESMANSSLLEIGPTVEAPKINATVTKDDFEVYVSLAGLIDVDAECNRLNKEKTKTENAITGNERKLSDEKFLNNAPDHVVAQAKDSLQQLKEKLARIEESLSDLAALK